MTNETIAIIPGAPCATKSYRSDDLCVQDAIEDDDVREVLRTFHKVPARPIYPLEAATVPVQEKIAK